MATFAFKAVDLAGVPQNGELDAGDKQTVAQELRGKGWSSSTSRSSSPRARGDILARFRKVKARDLTVSTRQFSAMVNSGISLLRSIYVPESRPRATSSRRR